MPKVEPICDDHYDALKRRDPGPYPELSEAESQARIRQLEAAGYEVMAVNNPEGGVTILKRKRGFVERLRRALGSL